MKKVLFGLILGLGSAFAFSAQAEEVKSFIGAQIEGQFSVTVNGEVVSEPGIVINGVSYLPTRTIAELAGFDVSFDVDTGIKLTKQIESVQSDTIRYEHEEVIPIGVKEVNTEEIERQIRIINNEIQELQSRTIYMLDVVINDPLSREAGKQEAIQKKANIENRISELEQMKSDLEDQLAELVGQ